MASELPSTAMDEVKSPRRSSRWRRWALPIAALLLIPAAVLWPRQTRIALSDGRVLVVEKVTTGPAHASYAPFELKTLWRTLSSRRAWPNTTCHGLDGSIGVFYHSDPVHRDHTDHLFLADVDGWWWSPIQQGHTSETGRLAVFPPMRLPRSPHFEVWTDGSRTGGGVLEIRAAQLPAPSDRKDSSFPIRHQVGETLVVVHGLDVTVRDHVRPSESEVHLRVETFRAGRPVMAKLGEILVTNGEGRGSKKAVDANGRFTTTLSPYAPYWTVRLLVTPRPSEPTVSEGAITLDFVVRPQIAGTGAANPPPSDRNDDLSRDGR